MCLWREMVLFLNVNISAWLNNCVGHFNHRYFFCFCLFMTLGCVYCSISGRNLFLDAYNALEVRYSDLHNTVVCCCQPAWVFCPCRACQVLFLTSHMPGVFLYGPNCF